jgi:predicted amidohydrolase YtcJ
MPNDGFVQGPNGPASDDPAQASMILYGGVIHTFADAGDPPVPPTAIALRYDRILAVGDDRSILAHAGEATRRIDLGGRTVMPGLFDAHPHMDRLGLRARAGIAIAHCDSVASICEAVREAAARTPPGEWIVTLPMGAPPDAYLSEPSRLAEGRFPDRHDLDRAAPEHPVFIRSPWGWWTRLPLPAVANSLALQRAGITRDTPDPYRIEIVRDRHGDPTGLFLEHNRAPTLEYVLMRCVPRFSFENRLEGLRIAARLTRAAGVTGAFEGHGLTPAVIDAYRQLAAGDELGLRMQAALSLPSASFGDAVLAAQLATWAPRLSGVGHATGLFREEGVCLDVADPKVACILGCHYPYEHWAGHFYQSLSSERLVALGTQAARLGIRVCVLVCYELERVLQALEAIDACVPIAGLRWVAVHVTQASATQIERMRRLGLVATVTPAFMHHARDRFDLHRLGAAGTPIRALLDGGVPVALSTDGVPHSMLFAAWQALARRDSESGEVLGDSGLSRGQALRLATVAGHFLTHDETRRGPLSPGMDADLVVLDGDPLDCPLDELPQLPVDLTMVGGRIVYDRQRDGVPALP